MMNPGFISGSPYPIRQGNQLHLLLDGEVAFRRIAEAVEQAQHQVYAAITFMWPTFEFPDGRGAPLALLSRAAQRGVDVRLLFWQPDEETAALRKNAFWGAPEHFELLRTLHPGVSVRWDQAQPGYCQHQKLWLIDAEATDPLAFLGGLNLNPHSVARPGHGVPAQNHDLNVQLRGPAVADAHHNFVQRWNEASERHTLDGRWGAHGAADLAYPHALPAPCGLATVQVQRTLHPRRHGQGTAPVGMGPAPLDSANGERTIIAQYCQAIRQARRTVYLENQYLELPVVVEALHGAAMRGVEIMLVLPVQPDVTPAAHAAPERRAFQEARSALAAYPNVTLVGLAGVDEAGTRHSVWIHSKLLLIDDCWGTIGSANLHRFSAYGNAELNVTFWEPQTAQTFRTELLAEHLNMDTSDLDDRTALQTMKRIAADNRGKLIAGQSDWQGIAVALDLATYGLERVNGLD